MAAKRLIILLSILRKILAVCLIERTFKKLSTNIPLWQAAYQGGRSTTEQVFAIKILAEKAVINEDYNIHILMLDMSEAFDTVIRKKLLTFLKEVLNEDELHLMNLLIKDVNYKVQISQPKLAYHKVTV